MTRLQTILASLLLVALASCSDPIKDRIHADFESRKEQLAATDLYSIFDTPMTGDEREAMEFLYAYMPLPDMTDYPGEFYLDNVKASLRTREEMPWGKDVPEREFRHFVLPVRVNNENLDSSRMVFYKELKERVEGLSMTEAVLEINHWCHEKVTYRPSDSRTSSPLASVRTAHGRCGEESTFTVAALRAMGIPARQVYTPRWAHTDDNHAWVEAWADGAWHFLGACEPEAILDLGWFNAPASRGMMMNTKVMGAYDGPEEQLGTNNCYTEINVTANYAPVTTSTVNVVDTAGNRVEGATVMFKLYNYGEFYTIAKKTTDSGGNASLTTGLGDMLAWAADGNRYGFAKLSATADGGEVTVTLDRDMTGTGTAELDMVPPVQSVNLPCPTAEQAAENARRMTLEDSIRNAYTATFLTDDGTDAGKLLATAEGNHGVISAFLADNAGNPLALRLLKQLSEKDLKDVTREVLDDNLGSEETASPLFDEYVLNPRVANEMLSPYKVFLGNEIPADLREAFRTDPQLWVKWCADSIAIDPDWNPQRLRMSPRSVYKYRIADKTSRDIFFVAGARSMGIAARIDPVTSKPQYAGADNNWNDVNFEEAAPAGNAPTGTLVLTYEPAGRLTDPAYYYHFTISKIAGGVPELLNFPDDSPWSAAFSHGTTLDAGQYLLTSGQRMADGTVLAHNTIFNIEPGKTTQLPLTMRSDNSGVQVIGGFNSENLYHDMATGTDKSLLSTTGRGYYILGIISPNHEPSTHALNDLSLYKEQLEQWGGKIMLLFADENAASRFDRSRFPSLPSTVVTGTDLNGKITNEIIANMELTDSTLPIFIVADTFNRVVYVVNGYNIGLGEQLVTVLHKL